MHAHSGHAGWLPRRTRELCCGAPCRRGARHIFALTGLLAVSTGTAAVPAAHGRAHDVGHKQHGRRPRQAAGTAAVPVETRHENVAHTRVAVPQAPISGATGRRRAALINTLRQRPLTLVQPAQREGQAPDQRPPDVISEGGVDQAGPDQAGESDAQD